nr:hypothetical protein [Tanacetum cinerariifolium]
RHKRFIVGELLVPPAIKGRKLGADVHLIHGRVKLHPRKAGGKVVAIIGKELGKLQVLKITQPVGHAKVAKVHDGHDVAPLQVAEGFVGKAPVVLAHPE